MGSLQQSLADQRSARLYELCAVLYHSYTCCRSCVRAGHEGMLSHQHRQCHQSWNRDKTLIPRYLWSVAHGSISSVKSEQTTLWAPCAPAAAAALVQTLSGFTGSLWSRLVSFASCNQPLWLLPHVWCCVKKVYQRKKQRRQEAAKASNTKGRTLTSPHHVPVPSSSPSGFSKKMWDW